MKYQIGKTGRVVIARFEDKEDILGNINNVAKKEQIRSAIFFLLGGIRQGKVVVGPEKDELPPTPVWRELQESHEALGIGTIFWDESGPKIHFHGAFGKKDMVKVGCLREIAETFLVLEAVIIEMEGINAQRKFDPASGLTLLELF
jgi:predicted DNA-binding protein with PD1-like motif